MKKTEHYLQVAIVNYLRLQYKDVLFFAIPNGGSRNVIEAANLKKEGVLRGVPDLLIAEPRGQFHALFLELKSATPYKKNGELKKDKHLQEQDDMMVKLISRGYYATFIWSFEQAKKVIDRYLKY